MDLLEALNVAEGHLVGRQPDDGSVLVVELVDIEGAVTADDGEFQPEMGEPRVPWAREATERGGDGSRYSLLCC